MRRRRHPVSLPVVDVPKRLGLSEQAYVAAVWSAPLRRVRIAHLLATQPHVSATRVIRLIGVRPKRLTGIGAPDDRPVVMRQRGRLYLINGHHRVEGRIVCGKRRVRVRLIDL